MASAEAALRAFVATQKRLLESELRAEEEGADRDKATGRDNGGGDGDGGYLLRNLDAVETSVGLYGRTVVTFGNASEGGGGGGEGENGASNHGIDARVSSSGRSSAPLLPAHRLTVGDEVKVLPNNGRGARKDGKKSRHVGGVISAVDDVGVSVALFGADGNGRKHPSSKESSHKKHGKVKASEDSTMDDNDGGVLGGNPPYALIPKSNVEVHQKIVAALDELERNGVGHPVAGDVVSAAFEPNNPKHDTDMSRSRVEALASQCGLPSTRLDFSQREAVVMALHSNSPISLIHGPPGTGKTTTVAELVRCAVRRRGWKVLVAAPSNVAVDNVLERVMGLEDEERSSTPDAGRRNKASKKRDDKRRIRAVRLGHPARIRHGIQRYSLESLVRSADGTEIVQDCRSELRGHLATLSDAASRPAERRAAYREMKSLRREIRTREERVVGEILRDADVVLATNVGAASSVLGRAARDGKGEPVAFDLVVIDEAAQALEASCWISLLRGKRAVLAGDHKQLPPTIKCSVREVQRGLERTLFERLMVAYEKGDDSCRSKMLEVQYRMHQDISDWASNAMYNGKLISHESVKGRQLLTLPRVEENAKLHNDNNNADEGSLEKVTLMLIDTTGCDMHETANEAGSKSNEGEGRIVASHVQSLIELGLRAEDIAVITPYNGQVELLRKMMLPDLPKLEIRSVDGFQGGEREAVVLSLVRSSDRGGEKGIGFLSDERRLNVAVTRAKRHCAVVCDCETVSKNKFIKGLVDWMEEKGEYRSGAEYDVHSTIEHSGSLQVNNIRVANEQKQAPAKQPRSEKPTKPKSNANAPKPSVSNDSSQEAKADNNAMNIEADRRAMMDKIKSFSESAQKDQELELSPSTEYDAVLARELAKQLGIVCRDGDDTNKLVLVIQKKKKTTERSVSPSEDINDVATTSKFAQLDIHDESSESSNGEEEEEPPNNLLRQLALEREKRQKEQPKPPVAAKPSASKKKKKKGKGQKLGGSKAKAKEESDDKLGDLDDMAFLDAQIERVQTSHGRKVDAKGKGYRSVVNGILLSKPTSQREEPKRNSAASSQLQAKIKSKAQDRKVKKKKK